MHSLAPRAALSLCAALALLAPATAHVWIVSSAGGPGVDFTDIPPAIAAAQPGDVVRILGGNYSSFVLDKGLTLISNGVNVPPAVQIQGIQAPSTAAIVGVQCFQYYVSDCSGTIVLQEIATFSSAEVLFVANCADVRIARSVSSGYPYTTVPGLLVHASRVETVECSFYGSSSYLPKGPPWATPGAPGVLAEMASRVHLAASSSFGGFGGPGDVGLMAGPGGAGIQLDLGAELVLAGDGGDHVTGGGGGYCALCSDCASNGAPAPGIANSGATTWHSGALIAGANGFTGSACTPVAAPPIDGGTVFAQVPDEPLLSTVGVPTAGATIRFDLRAEPGSSASLRLGRRPTVIATPGVLIEQLTHPLRALPLGIVPPNGIASRTLHIPSGIPIGTWFIAQAEVISTSGNLQRTNSCPIIVR